MTDSLNSSIALHTLDSLPVGVLLMEDDCITWVNANLANILRTPREKLIGLKAEQAAATVYAPLFEKSKRLCLTNPAGETCWLRCECMELDNTSIKVHYYEDITNVVALEEERDKLKSEVKALETRDPVTGLLNKNAIMQGLEVQISRSRRYDNPLSLLRISVEIVFVSSGTSDILRMISQGLKDQLRWADQIGLLNETTFLIILPETCLTDAKELATKLANDRTTLGEKNADWNITFGAASWQKGDDPRKLLQRLEEDQTLNAIALLS